MSEETRKVEQIEPDAEGAELSEQALDDVAGGKAAPPPPPPPEK